jgi:hypothetical protein
VEATAKEEMAQPYPPNVISRAKELWSDVGSKPTFDSVAKALKKEFGLPRLTRKTVHEWCIHYGWTQPTDTALTTTPPVVVQMVAPAPPLAREELGLPTDDDLEDFDWERKRLEFLAKLAGVADACLALEQEIDKETGKPTGKVVMRFRDDDSKFKVGMAAVELMGKINSGRFDPPEAGDKVPQLKPGDVKAVIAFFVSQSAPEPKFGPVITIRPAEEDTDADSDGQATRGNETRRLQISDRERDLD